MLTFNFTRLFRLRGIEKPFSYLVSHGYSENFASRIKNNRIESLRLKDLERLCDLFQCTPNDLFQWTPEKKDQSVESHHLFELKRNYTAPQMTKLINSVPFNKLADIEKLIKQELEK